VREKRFLNGFSLHLGNKMGKTRSRCADKNERIMIKVILKRGREESLLRFHPWVFSGAIAQVQGSPAEGDLVAVHASDGSQLAYGHYQIGSIAVRVLSFDDSALHPEFWETMLARALQVRIAAGLHTSEHSCGGAAETNCYRLVHGEGDNLPGLIIDYYDGVCVMQAHSVGMFRAKKQISAAIMV
jgi:23S rRNA (cytosine1962-C5)-methyltransferase